MALPTIQSDKKGAGSGFACAALCDYENAASNMLIVGTQDELGVSELTARDVNWLAGVAPQGSFRAQVKTRYTAKEAEALIVPLMGIG